MKILAYRPRPTGTEVSVLHNGREYLFTHQGDKRPTHEWVEAALAESVVAETEMKLEADAERTLVTAVGFVDWLRANRRREDLREFLLPLVRVYREEVR